METDEGDDTPPADDGNPSLMLESFDGSGNEEPHWTFLEDRRGDIMKGLQKNKEEQARVLQTTKNQLFHAGEICLVLREVYPKLPPEIQKQLKTTFVTAQSNIRRRKKQRQASPIQSSPTDPLPQESTLYSSSSASSSSSSSSSHFISLSSSTSLSSSSMFPPLSSPSLSPRPNFRTTTPTTTTTTSSLISPQSNFTVNYSLPQLPQSNFPVHHQPNLPMNYSLQWTPNFQQLSSTPLPVTGPIASTFVSSDHRINNNASRSSTPDMEMSTRSTQTGNSSNHSSPNLIVRSGSRDSSTGESPLGGLNRESPHQR